MYIWFSFIVQCEPHFMWYVSLTNYLTVIHRTLANYSLVSVAVESRHCLPGQGIKEQLIVQCLFSSINVISSVSALHLWISFLSVEGYTDAIECWWCKLWMEEWGYMIGGPVATIVRSWEQLEDPCPAWRASWLIDSRYFLVWYRQENLCSYQISNPNL